MRGGDGRISISFSIVASLNGNGYRLTYCNRHRGGKDWSTETSRRTRMKSSAAAPAACTLQAVENAAFISLEAVASLHRAFNGYIVL